MQSLAKTLRNKKGYSIWQLVGLGVAFVVVTLIISFGALILSNIQASQCNNGAGIQGTLNASGCYNVTGFNQFNGTAPFNITGYGITSLISFGTYLPTLAIVVIAAVIIGILITYLVMRLFSQGTVGSGA